ARYFLPFCTSGSSSSFFASPGDQPWTAMPIERAVPATWRLAASMSSVLRSGSFTVAFWVIWASVIDPACSRPAAVAPLSMPTASLMRDGVGGVLSTKENERSSKIVISTGTIVPRWFSVAALYCLQNSMVCTPCGPSAVPTGGAGGELDLHDCEDLLLLLGGHDGEPPGGLELGDLAEIELDRSLAAEDVDQHLQLQLVLVD